MKKYMKAVTFSYDDGVESDKELIGLLNKYGLKCSFNLNSGLLNGHHSWYYRGYKVCHAVPFDAKIYDGHEVCLHGTVHRHPLDIPDGEMEQEFLGDKQALEALFQTEIEGGAYAYGEYDGRTMEYLRSIGIRYCRTVSSSFHFAPAENMMAYAPTCHHRDENVFELIDRFISLKECETPQIFYLWGHSYEIPAWDHWDRMEEICKRLSGHKDILYGTNTEVFRYFNLI